MNRLLSDLCEIFVSEFCNHKTFFSNQLIADCVGIVLTAFMGSRIDHKLSPNHCYFYIFIIPIKFHLYEFMVILINWLLHAIKL